MDSAVKIRGSKHGINVKLDNSASYEEIKSSVASEFKEAEKFFGDEKLAISFEGKYLTDEQQEELVDIIHQNCNVHIVCIVDQTTEQEKRFQKTVLKELP